MGEAADDAQTVTHPQRPLLRLPLYLQILIALVLGVGAGLVLRKDWAEGFNIPAQIILRLLGAIAPPLILVAVVRALVTAEGRGRLAGKRLLRLALNTVVAILIALLM